MSADYKMLIHGELVAAEGNKTLTAINPANGETIAKFPKASVEDTQKAIAAAREAFDSGEWPRLSNQERGQYLLRIAALIKEKAQVLSELETNDSGKTIKETTFIDIPTAASVFEYFATCADQFMRGKTIPVPAKEFNYTVREPIGVIGQIIPWNYPFLFLAWKIAPAIAVGNTVVIKPASLTSLTALELAKIIQEADLPKGVVNIVTGSGSEVGAELARNKDVDKISLIGSSETGQEIMKLAAGNVKKVALELGGKSANIVFEDADLETAVNGAMTAIFLNQGQMCTAGSRLLIDEKIHDKFVKLLVEKTQKLTIGNPLEHDTNIGPLASKEQQNNVAEFVKIAKSEGAKLVAGGKAPVDQALKNGYYFEPTIFDGVTNDMRIAQEEVFSLVLSIITFKTIDEAIQLANDTPYGLAAMIWTNNVKKAHHVASKVKAGTIWINTYGSFHSQMPFGGYKQSGFSKELGEEGLLEYTNLKAINMDVSIDGMPLVCHWFNK
ncbi:aldehyde dehydrogenase family protein [Candidatus Omnitrophota bacterium]